MLKLFLETCFLVLGHDFKLKAVFELGKFGLELFLGCTELLDLTAIIFELNLVGSLLRELEQIIIKSTIK